MESNNERTNEETPAQSFDENENNENDPSELGDGEDVQGKMFIGGLSWSTTESTLRYYFEKYGELSDVALMLDKKTGKPRGFGFIKMKDPAAADVVLANEHTIDGRLVDVKRALPRDKAPGPARSEACKIFVGGLSLEVTETEFKDHFGKYGVVKEGIIMYDRNSGLSRGFGFITFEKEDSVEAVLKTEHELKGKVVEIKRAEPREPRGSGFDNQFNGGQYNGGGGSGGRFSKGGNFGGRGGGRGGNNFNQQSYGGYMNNMSRYNPYGGGYRGAPYAAPAAATPIYGYPAAPINAVGYYGAIAPAAGGYAGYAGAAVPYPAAPDFRAANGDASKGYDANQMRPVQQFGYGAGPMPAYAGYVYAPAVQAAPTTATATTTRTQSNSDNSNTGQSYSSEQGNYGAYKGATQGRADRSYRPY